MASYDIAQYLLDRANIHDTVTKVPLYYDMRNLDGLRSDVYAGTVEIDYTSILGGQPYTISRSDWVDQAGKLLDSFVATQHITSGIIIANLPQPTAPSATHRPQKVTVHAQAGGTLVSKSKSGDGSTRLTQNGGLLEVELQREDEVEKQGLNPWRITKYKVTKIWDRGDKPEFDVKEE